MINNWGDLNSPDKNILSEAEEKFKSRVRERTGYEIRQTMHTPYASFHKRSVDVWLSKDSYEKWMMLEDSEREEVKKEILIAFSECFEIGQYKEGIVVVTPDGIAEEVSVHVYGYLQKLVSYIYSAALSPLREWLAGLYDPVHQVLLYMDYNKPAYLRECEPSFFPELEKDDARIRAMAFHTLKEYDRFDLLRYEDMKMTIRAHDSALAKRDNDIYMTNYFGE